jgi:hypothetical protein
MTNIIDELFKKEKEKSKQKIENEQFNRDYETKNKNEEYKERIKITEALSNIDIRMKTEEELEVFANKFKDHQKTSTVNNPLLGVSDWNIHLSPKQFLLFGSKTGAGKSTAGGNFVLAEIKKKNKVLYISNEESETEIIERLAFLQEGHNVNYKSRLSDNQKKRIFEQAMDISKYVTIIEDIATNLNGVVTTGQTTTIEGVKNVIAGVKKAGVKYDLIIIDYFQKMCNSVNRPNANQTEILSKVHYELNNFRAEALCPVVLFTQLKPDLSGKLEIQERIKWCQSVMDSCTVCVEIIANRETLSSDFIVQKHREDGTKVGYKHTFGYKGGKLVEYTSDFKAETLKNKQDKEVKDLTDRSEASRNKNIVV